MTPGTTSMIGYRRFGDWFSVVKNDTEVIFLVNLTTVKQVRIVDGKHRLVLRFFFKDGTSDDLVSSDIQDLAYMVHHTIMGLKA